MKFYIVMKKIYEIDTTVSYKFETDITNEAYFDKRGRELYRTKTIYGYCTFNKKNERFILDEGTDPFFLTKNNEHVVIVWSRLLKVLQLSEKFPETICYAA